MIINKFSLPVYLLSAGIITCILAVIYGAVQQNYRVNANDPQIQIAREIDTKIRQGKPVDNFFADTIDIAQSLSPVAVLYDNTGRPIRSSGYLDGNMLQLPAGVFDFVKSHGEHQVTWQPRSGVRMAMVVKSADVPPVGFVASGRSLQEVEIREHNLMTMVFLGWLICIALLLIHAVLQFYAAGQKVLNN